VDRKPAVTAAARGRRPAARIWPEARGGRAARALHAARFMRKPSHTTARNQIESDRDVIPTAQLARVTGGGIASQFGSMFGPEGAKWGGMADQIMGMFGVG
jgi:hypothetical protein